MDTLDIGIVLMLGIVAVYLIAFWGSAIFKGLYIYVNDGEKSCKDLCDFLHDKSFNKSGYLKVDPIEYFAFGVLLPFGFTFVGCLLVVIILKVVGLTLAVYLASIVTVSYLALYTLRGVVRLNKKLDKHTSDKDAHK